MLITQNSKKLLQENCRKKDAKMDNVLKYFKVWFKGGLLLRILSYKNFLGYFTDAEAEVPILWPPDSKSQLIGSLWCWERLRARGEGSNRGWDDWVASLTRWTLSLKDREAWYPAAHGVAESDPTEWLNNNKLKVNLDMFPALPLSSQVMA